LRLTLVTLGGTLVTMTRCKKTESELKEHWEKILADEGLSMDAGRTQYREPGGKEKNRHVHVGNAADLEDIHQMLAGENGRVRPKGAGPDDENHD
jgi:hypothetical protein